ncbi:glycosyltransferase [Saltatorellus ferox]|uniref:glycosyltransferase n=1 Tax=Saltatorellus ferox TaxID=2528018 RepID=UPI003AF3FC0E
MQLRIDIHNRFSAHENRFFRAELDGIGAGFRIVPGGPDMAHRTRLEQVVGWWRLIWSAWKKSGDTLSERPRPDFLFVNTHLELLVFTLRRRLVRGARPRVALVNFIVAQNGRGLSSRLRRLYYGRVLAEADLAFCHTRHDLDLYAEWYPSGSGKLRFQPFGFAVDPHESEGAAAFETPTEPYLFSAGRSSRDYATLIGAVEPLGLPLYIACDKASEIGGGGLPPNIHLLRDCYGAKFRAYLGGARVLVTPLQPVEHSAGQMVVLEGLALEIPQVVTEVPGIVDYVDQGRAARMVAPGDVGALRQAITDLWASEGNRADLARRGRSFFEAQLTRRSAWEAMTAAAEEVTLGVKTLTPPARKGSIAGPRGGPELRPDAVESTTEGGDDGRPKRTDSAW